jgi:hypothetical protein
MMCRLYSPYVIYAPCYSVSNLQCSVSVSAITRILNASSLISNNRPPPPGQVIELYHEIEHSEKYGGPPTPGRA